MTLFCNLFMERPSYISLLQGGAYHSGTYVISVDWATGQF